MDSTQISSLALMNPNRSSELVEDMLEGTCFGPVGGGSGVAVHGITLPYDRVARLLHGFDVLGKHLCDFVFAISCDEHDFSNVAVGVDGVE